MFACGELKKGKVRGAGGDWHWARSGSLQRRVGKASDFLHEAEWARLEVFSENIRKMFMQIVTYILDQALGRR